MKIDVIEEQGCMNPIIRTTKQELFNVKSVNFEYFKVFKEDLIKDEALNLFFKGLLSIQIAHGKVYDYHAQNLIRFLKSLESHTNVDRIILTFDSRFDFNISVFEPIERLQSLKSKMNVYSLDSAKIGRLLNVKILDLSSVNIKFIEPNTFTGTPNLQELILNYNRISDIGPSVFNGIIDLKGLHFDGNELESIGTSMFENLLNLETLSIHSNRINLMDENAFVNLNKLKHLNLSYNQLETLGERSFAGLVKLESLKLRDNKIGPVHSLTFAHLSNLKQLNLSCNMIDIVHVDWLSDLANLLDLNLSFQTFDGPQWNSNEQQLKTSTPDFGN